MEHKKLEGRFLNPGWDIMIEEYDNFMTEIHIMDASKEENLTRAQYLTRQIEGIAHRFEIDSIAHASQLRELLSYIPSTWREVKSYGLPCVHAYYLVTRKPGHIQIAYFCVEKNVFYYDIGQKGELMDVLAWMELPEPFKSE
jgi:hypothetical protein